MSIIAGFHDYIHDLAQTSTHANVWRAFDSNAPVFTYTETGRYISQTSHTLPTGGI